MVSGWAVLARLKITGQHVKGYGVGKYYVEHPYYNNVLQQLLNCKPYPGTFNIKTDIDWRELAIRCKPHIIPGVHSNDKVELGGVYVWHAWLEKTKVLLIRPLKSKHEPNVLELIACTRLEGHDKEYVVVEVECS
ncbi:MAG TPA: DUF120 domain-containing protein [Pyrodictiaceae archaeon]|nr:DUF120 domain-containing protein [Pyrodictiaceae archaeon]